MDTTIDYTTIYVNIFLLLFIMGILILMVKYVSGDFKPVETLEVDRQCLEIKDINDLVISKTFLYTYKNTYRDGSIKYKTKKFVL